MSLRLWIPYTNGVKNQGISPYTITNTGTSDSSGKLGNCYSFNLTYTKVLGSPISGLNKFSIACWAYLTSSTYNIFTFENDAYWLFVLQNNQLGMRDNVSGSTGNRTYKNITSLPTSTWFHLTVTYNLGNVSIYWNGVLKETKTFSGTSLNSHNLLYIGADAENGISAFPGNCKINDFRVYDHCLSEDEIHELSLGKVGHWCLNDYEISRSKCANVNWNLIYNVGLLTSSSTSDVSYSVNNLGQITYTVSAIPTVLRDCPANSFANNNIFIENHKYYIDFNNSGNSGLTAYVFCNNTNMTYGNSSSPTIFTVNSSDLSTSYAWTFRLRFYSNTGVIGTYHCYPVLVDLTKMFGSGNEPTVELFKQMFPLHYYPYDAGTVKDLTLPIPDISGYHNDLTINGNCSLVNSTKRYSKCINIPEATTLTCANPFAGQTTQLEWSISCWIKASALTDWQSKLNNFNYGNYLKTADNLSILYLNAGTNDYYSYAAGCPQLNIWTHVVFVFKNSGGLRQVWINGVLKASNGPNKTSTPLGMSSTIEWFTAYGGDISDLRLYATALSADDVLKLYKLGNV